jgi:ADP-heptose:LPS heptosyltransferase
MTPGPAASPPPSRILVIKLGALGNVVLSLGPFAAIRRHHAGALITLLTTSPYAEWLATSPWFDSVWTDERHDWWDVPGWLRLRRRLIDGRFNRIYDLQTSSRTSYYFQLLGPGTRPAWSGIARGCALPDRDPQRDHLHDVDRQFGQLRQAGVDQRNPADLSWSQGDIKQFALPEAFALLAPGTSPHRLLKRWPIARYRELASMLASRGITPVVIGTAPERKLAQAIRDAVPHAIDLTGRTEFAQLASLARAARVAIGNDTGTMHLIAGTGCPSIVLFSRDSDPALCAPRGPDVSVLQRADLSQLATATVLDAAVAALPASSGVLAAS